MRSAPLVESRRAAAPIPCGAFGRQDRGRRGALDRSRSSRGRSRGECGRSIGAVYGVNPKTTTMTARSTAIPDVRTAPAISGSASSSWKYVIMIRSVPGSAGSLVPMWGEHKLFFFSCIITFPFSSPVMRQGMQKEPFSCAGVRGPSRVPLRMAPARTCVRDRTLRRPPYRAEKGAGDGRIVRPGAGDPGPTRPRLRTSSCRRRDLVRSK